MPEKTKKNLRGRLKKGLVIMENRIKSARRNTSGKKTKKSGNKSRKKTRASSSSWKKTLFFTCLYLALALFLLLCAYAAYCWFTLPDLNKALLRTRQPSTVILAENGSDIAKFGNVYAEVIYPDRLPKNITNAIIATEDRRFYSHFGFDVWGFGRAMITNIFRGRYAQGASTITQQVAKNVFLTPNKTIKRKVQELLLSFWLEKKLTKNQIMALYLNRVYFGSGVYGAEAAANWYFNKDVYDLNLREAAILAGMLKAPNRYNPILRRADSLKRADVVLHNMRETEYLTEEEYQKARQLPVSNGQEYRVVGGKYFADYVYDEVNGNIGERSADVIVMTTLDQKLQETAERIMRSKIAAAKGQNVSEGALVILDRSGAVKAMTGGVDYNRSQFNRAVQARRQPGSAFKPFVYLTALQYGFSPESTVNDAPLKIGKWQPENYTKKYYGNVTLDYALSHSLNVATAALSRELYLKDIADNARRMGITTNISLTPSMVLGTNGVKVIDMAAAYAVLATGGKSVFPYAVNEISTKDGQQLYVRGKIQPEQILDRQAVKELTQMLEHVITEGTGKKARLPYFAAGKTGTTQNYRDAWFVGWTSRYIAAVWVGNDNEVPMNRVGGGNLPAEIWHDIMAEAMKNISAVDPYDEFAAEENTSGDDIEALIEKNASDEDDGIEKLIEQSESEEKSSLETLLDSIF